MNKFTGKFTLIEVVVAMAVLTLSVASIFALLSAASRRVEKADSKWRQNHLLAQAAEFYLLYPPEAEIDRKYFPYDDFSVSCEYDSPENLPDETPEQIGLFRLTTMKIRLYNKENKELDTVSIDRIIGAVE